MEMTGKTYKSLMSVGDTIYEVDQNGVIYSRQLSGSYLPENPRYKIKGTLAEEIHGNNIPPHVRIHQRHFKLKGLVELAESNEILNKELEKLEVLYTLYKDDKKEE